MSKYPTHTLSELATKLKDMLPGNIFKITGQEFIWELYDTTSDFYWVRNTISKQKILIKKL